MFKLFKNKRVPTVYRLPPDLRLYAVGDIHGRGDLVKQLHDMIVMDAGQADNGRGNQVVYLGDYLDRGPYVREALDEVMSGLPESFEAEYLKGNHEALFLDFLEDASLLEMWLGLGGQATLMSYGVPVPGSGFSMKRAEDVRQALLEAMPRDHLAFLKDLKAYVQKGDYLFVHAGIRPGIALEKQSSGDLFWIRDEFTKAGIDCGLKVVHGHTIDVKLQARDNRVGVDTGAYATGVLSCAVLEDDQVRFLSTGC